MLTGYQLPLVPKLSFTALAAYDWAVGEDWKAHFGGDVHWVGRTWSNPVTQYSIYGSPSTRLPAYATADFDANVVHGRFTYRLFVRNVTNKHALQTNTYIANALRQPVQANYSINQPRTIGVGFDAAF